jgi:hypothetical protein
MRGTTRLAVFAPAAISLAMVGFIATSWFPFGVLCAAIMGAAMSVHGICAQTLAQSASDPAMRGRVLSLWGLIVRAFPALGALLLGAGTAGLLAGSSLILQVGAPMALRGRMAGLGQIAFLGGGGVSVTVIDQRRSGEAIRPEVSNTGTGREIRLVVRDAVRADLADGSLDRDLSMAYGLRRAGTRR